MFQSKTKKTKKRVRESDEAADTANGHDDAVVMGKGKKTSAGISNGAAVANGDVVPIKRVRTRSMDAAEAASADQVGNTVGFTFRGLY